MDTAVQRTMTPPQRQDSKLSVQTPAKHPNPSVSSLLAIPTPNFDPPISFDFIEATPIREKETQLQKLAQENERLARELRELNARLEEAERKSRELEKSKQVGLKA